jgi:hypothetical protein
MCYKKYINKIVKSDKIDVYEKANFGLFGIVCGYFDFM